MPDAGQPHAEFSVAELRDLIWAAHSGEIDEAGVARLDVLLQSGEAARRYYVQYTRLLGDVQAGECEQGDLRHEVEQSVGFETARAAIPGQSVPLPSLNVAGFSVSRMSAGLLLAAIVTNMLVVVLMVVLLTPSLRKHVIGDPIAEVNTPAAPLVTVKSTRGARWASAQDAVQAGAELDRGERTLLAGTIELEFAKGTQLTIHGPSVFDLQSPDDVRLEKGRLRATVPAAAVGFTVTTPQATVIDLGTEFGVTADDEGATEVHVFQGTVDLRQKSDRGDLGAAIRLHAGDARQVRLSHATTEASVTTIAAAPEKFLSAIATSGQPAWADRWQAHRNALLSDRRLVALYDFESRGETLPSQQTGKLTGRIECTGKPPWVAGRVREKSALAFGEQFAQVVVDDAPELRLDEATLVVWLRLDVSPSEPTLIVGKGVAPLRNYCLWVQPANKDHDDKPYFQWNLFTTDGRNPIISASSSIELGSWYCVAGVAAKDQYVMYVNGQEAARGEPLKSTLAKSDDSLRFGLSPFDCPGRLTAVIDEVAIFNRGLNAKEIKKFYEAGKGR